MNNGISNNVMVLNLRRTLRKNGLPVLIYHYRDNQLPHGFTLPSRTPTSRRPTRDDAKDEVGILEYSQDILSRDTWRCSRNRYFTYHMIVTKSCHDQHLLLHPAHM